MEVNCEYIAPVFFKFRPSSLTLLVAALNSDTICVALS